MFKLKRSTFKFKEVKLGNSNHLRKLVTEFDPRAHVQCKNGLSISDGE